MLVAMETLKKAICHSVLLCTKEKLALTDVFSNAPLFSCLSLRWWLIWLRYFIYGCSLNDGYLSIWQWFVRLWWGTCKFLICVSFRDKWELFKFQARRRIKLYFGGSPFLIGFSSVNCCACKVLFRFCYRPQRSCGQGNIFTPVCHSVHRGGMSEADHPPPQEQTPPQVRPPLVRPPRVRPPRVRHPPGADTTLPPPEQTPAYGQRAAGTHPTGMQSCYIWIWEEITGFVRDKLAILRHHEKINVNNITFEIFAGYAQRQTRVCFVVFIMKLEGYLMQHVYIFFPVNKPIFLLVDLSQFYGLVFVLSYIRKLRSRFHHS